MKNKGNFDEVGQLLKNAHYSILKNSGYELPFTDEDAAKIVKILKNEWLYFRSKFLEKGYTIAEAIKSYKPEQTLWMRYGKIIEEKVKKLKKGELKELEEFLKTRGVQVGSQGFHYKSFHGYPLDETAHLFFTLEMTETENFKEALEKLQEALE
jgi:hypothetical protein